MGTRNLVCVVVDKTMKVAQYGQWDGYISGQGKTVFDFIQNKMDLTKLKDAVRSCHYLTAAQVDATWTECGASPDSNLVGFDVAEIHKTKHPALSRDTGAEVLALIQDQGARGLDDASSFAADSLFCEYAYVLDLDNEMLEIYKGFNKTKVPVGQRFSELKGDGKGYEPICLLAEIPFSEVNSETLAALTKETEKED